MTAVVRGRYRYLPRSRTVSIFLRALGVPFRVDPGNKREFWQANAHLLPEIYRKMVKAARDRLHQLHPDKGGSPDVGKFITDFRAVKKAFRCHMTPAELVAKPSRVRAWRPGQFNRRVNVGAIISLLDKGVSTREAARQTGFNRATIVKVRRLICADALCACGRPLAHIGLCSARQKKPRWQSSAAGRVRMRNIKLGKARDSVTRAKISETFKRKYAEGWVHPMKNLPRSMKTRAKIKAACNRPEAIAKMSAANKGRPKKKVPPEIRIMVGTCELAA